VHLSVDTKVSEEQNLQIFSPKEGGGSLDRNVGIYL
jgi:hypothetical protein